MKKVLIANRGEIAVRIARACADYGVRSVAVYADADADALHVQMADEAWALQGQRPADTYLDIDKLLQIARRSGADAVHPGYGFLSERAEFARAVIDAGLTWIGPNPATIEALGDKVAARKIAQKVGAPLVAGTAEPVQSAGEVLAFAEQHGLPIAIKAAFGGGGRGLKVAWRMDEVAELYESAVREATAAFGRGECFLEQFLDKPRHIEAQVLADTHGNVVVLGTRDCSLQRRNQKLVEEAPAPFLTDAQRQRIHAAAHAICAEAGYVSAGTVEFLLSGSGQISFLEVNTRLQVEHPVTEETTGIDLVVEQLRIADGLPLALRETPASRGHSIEFRINAEDPGRGYLPTPGLITGFTPPAGPGVRIDSGVASGSLVPGSFDSMMAKLIVTGATREQALARARRALAEFRIEGVASVLPFHRAVLQDADFTGEQSFRVHTRWIETEFAQRITLAPRPEPHEAQPLVRSFIEVDGKRMALGLPAGLLQGAGATVAAPLAAAAPAAAAGAPAGGLAAAADAGAIKAPITGTLLAWKAADGAAVKAGDVVAVMEAMKMETQVTAPMAGVLQRSGAEGSMVAAGDLLGRVQAETA
ncbi:ATP-grasp domain-containing protein [Corticibacter populi]|uniref:biotin carboxylase n=1 Tax=Corticibacter populi TaxID=1550736 RepID=A0A3M6QTY1_9BURK|nr:biotin carboxylase N-terminal domain-containing protein [Corticibacter populi]RMX06484.1 ATP-grasp domain-containing protein [Corticibacter populi]RZS31958.1 acetyl-CoA/propionyl-CoA carboxylase biotin carboxyl carrier protein [Corticibacter populi]